MVGCSFQRWPSTSWSTFSMRTVETRAKQLAKSCYIWSIATWCAWVSKGATWFRPVPGRSCAVPAGPIWEKQTFVCASFCKFGCDVWPVRWDAVFFLNVKGHCHGCFFDNIWQHWKAKNVKYTVANGRTCKSHLQEERQQIAVLLLWHTCVIREHGILSSSVGCQKPPRGAI